jgi:anti-anti-sigma regulatory factor
LESAKRRISLPAVLDDKAAESLRIELATALDSIPSRLCLDFGHVRQMSAAALSLLAALARESARRDPLWALDAAGVSAPMAALLRTTGLDRTFRSSE